ncbi:MAG TPA: hypothetical protein VK420_11675, partial [Longimicrobium sp.]|nr:hypothetical protein [Longimicrobium sp.]
VTSAKPPAGVVSTVAAAAMVRIAGCILYADKPPAKQAATKPAALELSPAFVARMRDARTGAPKDPFFTLASNAVKTGGRVGGGGVHAMQGGPQVPTGQGQMTPPPVGVVLALLDATAGNYLEDNIFAGYVRLYGEGPPASASQFQAMLGLTKASRLPEHGGALLLRGNLLYALRLDANAQQLFAKPGTPQAATVPFRVCTLTDNSFLDSFSQVVAAHHSVAGNQWMETASGDLLVAMGTTATFTGNTAAKAEGPPVVFAITPGKRVVHAANLLGVVSL